jgi:retron-type reverse transcriptase
MVTILLTGYQMTRQELYDEIKKSSKEAFILKEMKELGFWDSSKPQMAQELIERKIELQNELNRLSTKILNPEAVIKEIHKERMKAARLRREETQEKRAQAATKSAAKRAQQKEEAIGFIGHAFITSLARNESNETLLRSNNLFLIQDAKDLANKMGITLKALRFVTYTQKLSTHTHYVRFKMVKKSGGYRDISSPKPQLKRLQYWILDNILYKIAVRDEAHGFVPKRNILTNALPHVQKAVVINADLQNFFPTIDYARVKGLFKSLGFSHEIATLLALIVTEAEQKEVILDGEKLFLYTGKRYLPQGSPASPMITNLICRRLDKRLKGIATTLGFDYSRYADDMSFSSLEYRHIHKMLFWLKKIVKEEGFALHPDKTRIMKKGSRQEVTGVVVNDKPAINRRELKKFRALLYQIEQSGLEGKSWQGKRDNLMSVIWGYANFIKMVDPAKGSRYLMQVKELLKRYPIEVLGSSDNAFREKSADGKQPWHTLAREVHGDEEGPREETVSVNRPSLIDSILNIFRR